MRRFLLLLLAASPALPHDAHGRSNSPPEARHLKSPLAASAENAAAGQAVYEKNCASCHGADGKSRTPAAATLPVRPTDLAEYLMESMRDGEIYWVATNGIPPNMPRFDRQTTETQRWQLVQYVRELRSRQAAEERKLLGPYKWHLPAGLPFPKVPADNLMTEEKVELGQRLFYDKRLSFNNTQSCASCHKQELAFTDGRAQGLGSTGELHPRGPMSLVNVAYATTLTWANPLVRALEAQALVPMFGDRPVELGMTGKENVLIERLKAEPVYQKLFSAAFPDDRDPWTIAAVTRALASFERTILSGDSPYDHYQRGDDPSAISASAKRGETLFFSERLECFHCHGGFNFTGSVNYLGKGFAEVEFHNTGLYNLKGKFSYPEPNVGLYEFTQEESDIGKFKAPTLRNIALTAPYMHDGSVRTLDEAIEHYKAGGRTIRSGSYAGVGSANPNRSEFVTGFSLTPGEKIDLIEFLKSLTDETLITEPRFSDPWGPAKTQITRRTPPKPGFPLRGEVVNVFDDTGSVSLHHDEVRGLMAMPGPKSMEFIAEHPDELKRLHPGDGITATVRRRGYDYILENVRIAGKWRPAPEKLKP